MSLKATEVKKQEPVDDSIVLEMALFNNYNHRGTMYVMGTPYRFKKEDALNLLSERDAGRPIWKIHRPVKKVEARTNVVVDATMRDMGKPIEPIPGAKLVKRIEIGSEDEIADILKGSDDLDNVTI